MTTNDLVLILILGIGAICINWNIIKKDFLRIRSPKAFRSTKENNILHILNSSNIKDKVKTKALDDVEVLIELD